MLDPLAELGLDPSVDHSRAAVKKRYREMAMRYHPDKNPGDAAAEERFKKISAAYQILTDPRAKAEWEARTRSEEDARRSRDEYHFSQGRDPFESRFATGFGGGGMGPFDSPFGPWRDHNVPADRARSHARGQVPFDDFGRDFFFRSPFEIFAEVMANDSAFFGPPRHGRQSGGGQRQVAPRREPDSMMHPFGGFFGGMMMNDMMGDMMGMMASSGTGASQSFSFSSVRGADGNVSTHSSQSRTSYRDGRAFTERVEDVNGARNTSFEERDLRTGEVREIDDPHRGAALGNRYCSSSSSRGLRY